MPHRRSLAAVEEFVVRPITVKDIPSIRQLHVSSLWRGARVPCLRPFETSETVFQFSLLPVKYPPSFFLQLLIQPARACLIAHLRSNPDPIAFVSASIHVTPCIFPSHIGDDSSCQTQSPEPRVQILTLGVLPPFQKRGLASRLVRAIVYALREALTCKYPSGDEGTLVWAHVATSNLTAQQFYEHIGLRVCSEISLNLYRTLAGADRDGYLVTGRVRLKEGFIRTRFLGSEICSKVGVDTE